MKDIEMIWCTLYPKNSLLDGQNKMKNETSQILPLAKERREAVKNHTHFIVVTCTDVCTFSKWLSSI